MEEQFITSLQTGDEPKRHFRLSWTMVRLQVRRRKPRVRASEELTEVRSGIKVLGISQGKVNSRVL